MIARASKNKNRCVAGLKIVRNYFWIGFLFFAIIPNSAFGQACCSGGVPLGGSLGLGTAENRSLQFLLTFDSNRLNDLVAFDRILEDETRSRTTNSWLMEVNYGISSRWAATVVVPYITQIRDINGYEGAFEQTITQGLGDVVLLLKYRMLTPKLDRKEEWVIGLGPKLPTGRTTYTNANGLILQADMQPGSGSLDGFFWSYFQKNQLFARSLSLVNVVTFRKSGRNNSYNESQVYEFGDEFQFNLGLNYNLFLIKWPVDIFVFGRYRSQTHDLIDGSTFPSTGGKWFYLIPGINWSIDPNIAFRASTDLPLWWNLDGTQLTTSSKFTFSIFYNLSRAKKQENFNLNQLKP